MKDAFQVRSDVVELMREHVYAGDYDRPRIKPDAAGVYHYKDKKIRIELSISPRDGWLSCSVVVWILRRRFLFRKPEPVLVTGFGHDVEIFRPGRWCEYVAAIAEHTRLLGQERERRLNESIEPLPQTDARFTPIDDSELFEE